MWTVLDERPSMICLGDRARLVDGHGEAVHHGGGVDGPGTAGPRRHHADDLAGLVDHGPTGVAGRDGGVEPDHAAQPSGRAVALVLHRDLLAQRTHRPRHRARRATDTTGVADGDDLVADLHR